MSRVRTLTPNFTVLTVKMWAYIAKIAEICNFRYKVAQKGYTPLSDFYKIWIRGGSPRFAPSCQISSLLVKKMWEYRPKIAEIGNFWYKFAQRGIPLKRFLQNIAWRRESQVRTLMPNFVSVGKKCGSTAPKSLKLVIFGINLPKKGIPP